MVDAMESLRVWAESDRGRQVTVTTHGELWQVELHGEWRVMAIDADLLCATENAMDQYATEELGDG